MLSKKNSAERNIDQNFLYEQERRQHKIIAPEIAKPIIQKEIDQLPQSAILINNGRFIIYATLGKTIPQTMQEIGRLREISFRASKEGSGFERDLDEFDDESIQMFLWDQTEGVIAGAYRLNLISDQTQKFYTQTLFSIKPHFLKTIAPAIELGRSFIIPEYQRRPLSLFLLWQGIGEFIYRNQSYTTLFGPVSIASDYHHFSKSILSYYLKTHHRYDYSGQTVKPKTPWRVDHQAETIVNTLEDLSIQQVDLMVQALEGGRGIPVLLKHYLKINCKMLDFNVDPEFSNVLDGFILIDIKQIKPDVLYKYCQIQYNTDKQCLEKIKDKTKANKPSDI